MYSEMLILRYIIDLITLKIKSKASTLNKHRHGNKHPDLENIKMCVWVCTCAHLTSKMYYGVKEMFYFLGNWYARYELYF